MKQFQDIIERARGLKSESVSKDRRDMVFDMRFRSEEHNSRNGLRAVAQQNRPNINNSANSYGEDVIKLEEGSLVEPKESSISELDEKSIQEQEEEEQRWLKFLPHIKPKDLQSDISESEPDGIANELPQQPSVYALRKLNTSQQACTFDESLNMQAQQQ